MKKHKQSSWKYPRVFNKNEKCDYWINVCDQRRVFIGEIKQDGEEGIEIIIIVYWREEDMEIKEATTWVHFSSFSVRKEIEIFNSQNLKSNDHYCLFRWRRHGNERGYNLDALFQF